MQLHPSNEDLSGYIRGAHQEGEHVCEQYVFNPPGKVKGLWGWNDTSALYCKACGKLASHHIVLQEPKSDELIMAQQKQRNLVKPAVKWDNSISPEQLQSLRQTQAAAAKAAKTDLEMLDDALDPLSVGSGGARQAEVKYAPVMETSVADAIQLEKERMYSDAFKEEVERMVRESVARERRDNGEDAEAVSKFPKFSTSAELLAWVGLSQYASEFEREAMDPETLYEVMKHQGRVALEEVLSELGVSSKGHRMKIANAVAPE